jgi:hypothetical protein
MRFGTKVLPVVAVMGLLLTITVWTVNRRLKEQFQTEAARSLATADAVFRNSQKIRRNNLLLRYRNLPNEPRYKAVFQQAHPPTLKELLQDLLGEQGVDVISPPNNGDAGERQKGLAPPDERAEAASALSTQRIAGDERVDTIR